MRAMRWRSVLVILAVLVGSASVVGATSALDMTGATVNTSRNFGDLSSGWEFTALEALVVTGLGFYAPTSDTTVPLNYGHVITIYDSSGGVVVSGTVGPATDPPVTPDADGYAYVDVSGQEGELYAGGTYVIASYWTSGAPQPDFDIAYASGFGLATDYIGLGRLDLQSAGPGMPTTSAGLGWRYLSANFQFEPAPTVITVGIDIKPGSTPNTINLGSNGVIPVAILSSADFNALAVDTATVMLEGKAGVRVKGNGAPLAVERDVNGDGYVDMELKIEVENLEPGDIQDGLAEITGETTDGQAFAGADEVTIVPAE